MDVNARTLQNYDPASGCDEQYLEEDNEMVEWTCCECEMKFIDGETGDADERMCYECMERLEQEAEDYENIGGKNE